METGSEQQYNKKQKKGKVVFMLRHWKH